MQPNLNSNPKYKHIDESAVKYPDVLIFCRTVLEKNGYVTSGVLNYAEGDIIEIELSDHKAFELREPVKVTVYTPVRLINFTSTVVAKSEDGVVLLTPPDLRALFGEKRAYPRVEINQIGRIVGINSPNAISAETPGLCTIRDISEGGLGLVIAGSQLVSLRSELELELELSFKFRCVAQVVRLEEREESTHCGAQFVSIPDKAAQALRAYILVKQLDHYYQVKRNKPSNKR